MNSYFIFPKTCFIINATTIIDNTSAIGAEYNGHTIPKTFAKINIAGILNTKSLNNDNPIDMIGLPNACKNILDDFCTQHSTIVDK